ncbi:dynamin-like GTPase [Saccharomycopsis crataegensis]|uniref:Dynamin-like GTPase n=1 Tax=Saccharomycopsis crataegensis TaxID=43959 RepID=A0AAV5QSH9_9ASCO|nr:dynamin-like GTPase [Saccharomycopsis crataegensis]
MSTNQPSQAVQIVNEDQHFNKNILSYVNGITTNDIGLNYHIISVFGSQSTGKSTLLNALFGTKFDVMNESKRQQTTKGIWLAYASQIASKNDHIVNDPQTSPTKNNNHNNILVMDVEGTDGRERGEDQDFERKAALFALSTSEILIVNIWEHQVGLYQGANMGLLKTVFEVNLSLFAHSNPKKCLLLFVIRDHVGTTPLDSLSQVLTEDITKIWDSLNKPKELANAKLSDYFDLGFTSLSHKILKPEEFVSDVGRFGDDLNDGGEKYFKPQYHKEVPFDGWTVYSENIWDQIVQNKELDLPTQQVLVSRFRCDEIITASMEIFDTNFKREFPNFDGKNLKIAGDISEVFSGLKKEPLENYDNLASRYTKSVYVERRKQLVEKIDTQLGQIYKTYLSNIKKSALQLFHDKIVELKSKKSPFTETMDTASATGLQYFNANVIKDNASFKHDIELEELEKSLQELVESQRTREIKSLSGRIAKKFNSELKQKVSYLLNSPNEKTWDEISYVFNELVTKGLAPYKKGSGYDFGLGLTPQRNERFYYKLKKNYWKAFGTIIHDYLSEDNVVKILRDKFEDKFRYDEEGIPMVWKNSVEIDIQYKNARSAALALLPILSLAKTSDNIEIVPDLPDVEISGDDDVDEEEEEDDDFDQSEFAHILSDIQQNNVSGKFKKQIDIIYIDAKRSTIQSISSIPYWIYVVIVILGWNEFMAVIRNPLYFTFLSILLVAAYFIHQLNLWGPVKLVVSNTINETAKVSKAKLREILVEEHEPAESIAMKDLKE